MKNLTQSLLRIAVALFISAIAAAQEQTPAARLTISLPQKRYQVGDPVVLTYRITNASDSLLCLPPPSFNCYSISGGLGATATPPKGVKLPNTNGGCATDRRIDQNAGYDIDQHWIKLAPAQSYETTPQSRLIQLIAPGKWTVDAGYYPAREDTLSLYQDALTARGCSIVPELHSEKVVVTAKGELK